MSQGHRDHPELFGTDADPWMANESYRRIVHPPAVERPEPDDEWTDEDVAYERAQHSEEWDRRHGGGL